ncbi:hypothetical protein ABIE78_003949 [Sinorhizobium fredii]|jgi:hypothetical protein|uniref:DUF982 domain-containing protein n=1 Tax=Rhizobium fredii TaxID=380 RepID=UPI0009B6F7B3|nr:DUF982 domain-containing protein [Sinorhizobium fredii]
MKEVPWGIALSVTLQNGMKRQFCGPYDALDFLENEWPMHGGQQARAVRACRAALHHPQYSDWAKNSFIAACIEASFACSDVLGRAKPPRPDLTSASRRLGAGLIKR